jgi:hypothetical protein
VKFPAFCGRFPESHIMVSDVWEALILAILSVNSYSVEKTRAIAKSLRREGLFDPGKIADWNLNEIAARLHRAGYSRGSYLDTLLAARLLSLGDFVKQTGLDTAEVVLTSDRKAEIATFLRPVRGVGPQVIDTFVFLRTADGD